MIGQMCVASSRKTAARAHSRASPFILICVCAELPDFQEEMVVCDEQRYNFISLGLAYLHPGTGSVNIVFRIDLSSIHNN